MKKTYVEAMNGYSEGEKKPKTDFKKFKPVKLGDNSEPHNKDENDNQEDPENKNSIMSGK
jgi:hypothetical protein